MPCASSFSPKTRVEERDLRLKPERKRRIAAAQQEQKNTRFLFKGVFFLVRLGPEFLDIGQDFTLFAKLNYYGRNCSTCSRGFTTGSSHAGTNAANSSSRRASRTAPGSHDGSSACCPASSRCAQKEQHDIGCGNYAFTARGACRRGILPFERKYRSQRDGCPDANGD